MRGFNITGRGRFNTRVRALNTTVPEQQPKELFSRALDKAVGKILHSFLNPKPLNEFRLPAHRSRVKGLGLMENGNLEQPRPLKMAKAVYRLL